MKWQGRRGSDNIEDRRGMSGGKVAAGGGGLALILLLVGWLIGGDTQQLLSGLAEQTATSTTQSSAPVEESAAEKELSTYASVTLADNEQVWGMLFKEHSMEYKKPVMVLFRGRTHSPCGQADAQSGPFYCPADEKIYLDLSFFDELTKQLGAHGDFAMAYVIAHEVGHHVQYLLGTTQEVRAQEKNLSEKEANRLSVALELQADFYAGIWAHYNEKLNQVLEEGDIEEALSAANAVGDDRLQQQSQGYVVPDAFTHGTSQQRMYWFKKGFKTGDLNQGNTFDGM